METIFNPFDPTHYLDPHERLAQLREQCPVSEPNSWSVLVTRYDAIRQALRDTQALSNAGSLIFPDDADDPPTVFQLDPPEHTRLRRLQTHLTTAAISPAKPALEKCAAHLLAPFLEQGQGDLMELFATPFPLRAVMLLLGVPDTFAEEFYQCALVVRAHLPNGYQHLPAWKRLKTLIQYMIEEQRAGHAPTNMLSALLNAHYQDEYLKDDDIRMAIFQLTTGGANAVSLLIGNVVYRLLEQPDLWSHLLADPTQVPLAIEESLRYDAPAPWVMRLCRAETSIDGTPISPGKRVILSLTSANRQATHCSEPDTFSLTRSPGDGTHLSFGYGPHFCLGAPLARLIGNIALQTLLDHLPHLRLPPDAQFEGIRAAMLHGPASLPLLWYPIE